MCLKAKSTHGSLWQLLSAAEILLMLLCGIAVGGQAQGTPKSLEPAPAKSVEPDYRGGLVSPSLEKPKFTLTDTSGRPFDFRAKTQGTVTLLFFGYTHCPDVCPLQMQMLGSAMKKIPPTAAREIKVVFVTTDPDRDTPSVLRAYLDHFNKDFIGLTGSEQAIEAAQIAANLSPAKKSAVRPDGGYEVGHAAFVLAYTKDNRAHVIYPLGVQLDDLVHDLPLLTTETWAKP
ncbi:MAG: SCO family protein [Candidatus Acidiferrales bacterium]